MNSNTVGKIYRIDHTCLALTFLHYEKVNPSDGQRR